MSPCWGLLPKVISSRKWQRFQGLSCWRLYHGHCAESELSVSKRGWVFWVPFYSWEEWGPGRVSKVTQLASLVNQTPATLPSRLTPCLSTRFLCFTWFKPTDHIRAGVGWGVPWAAPASFYFSLISSSAQPCKLSQTVTAILRPPTWQVTIETTVSFTLGVSFTPSGPLLIPVITRLSASLSPPTPHSWPHPQAFRSCSHTGYRGSLGGDIQGALLSAALAGPPPAGDHCGPHRSPFTFVIQHWTLTVTDYECPGWLSLLPTGHCWLPSLLLTTVYHLILLFFLIGWITNLYWNMR